MAEKDFFLLGAGAVGYFEESKDPCADGSYRYMPYRSGSHSMMQQQLSAGQLPQCYYDNNNTQVSFRVQACPEYGVLELVGFQRHRRSGA